MQQYVIRRLLLFIPTLIGVSLIIFFTLRILPGDAALDLLLTEEGEGLVNRQNVEVTRVQLDVADEQRISETATVEIVKTRDKIVRMTTVQVVPESLVIPREDIFEWPGEIFEFRAFGFDADGFAIPNLKVEWELLNPDAGTRLTKAGELAPGFKSGVYNNAVKGTIVQTLPNGEKIERTVFASIETRDERISQSLDSVRIFPEKVRLGDGESFRFVMAGFDNNGAFFIEPRFRWDFTDKIKIKDLDEALSQLNSERVAVLSKRRAVLEEALEAGETLNQNLDFDLNKSGGGIDQGGRFRAGLTPGTYTLTGSVIKTNLIPVYAQYYNWVKGMFTGNPGSSFETGLPIIKDIFGESPGEFIKRSRFIVTLEMGILSFMVGIMIGIPVGIITAIRQDSFLDYFLRVITITGLAMPSFWVGILIILFLVRLFNWLPPLGFRAFLEEPHNNLNQMIWPLMAIATGSGAFIARMTRSQMLEVLRQDYIRTAWSKGLRERVILSRHALKNAILPIATLIGFKLAFILTGTVIMESLFNLPGIGLRLLNAVSAQDFVVVQFIAMLLAFIVLLVNLAVDLFYGWIDPRVRFD